MYIVVVDDDEMNNALMSEALRGLPDAVAETFTTGSGALEFVRENASSVGAAITDYEMPGMNGIEFIRSARAIAAFEHVPIIMVTSMDQRRLRREALACGATDFLGKPFDPVEVRARVSNLLALNQARREQQDQATVLAREILKAVRVIEAREREIVTTLVRAAEHRDTDTGDHVSRVAGYVELIAAKLGHDHVWCSRLALASTMHDVGKIGVPDAILLKPGPLTPEERTAITHHAANGHAILQGCTSDVMRLAAEVAISHHERWDGGGYPHGLAGGDIPLSGRIVAVADVFDALVSDRPYKKAWPLEEARSYLVANSGTQFDPTCVDALLASWAEVLRVGKQVDKAA